MPELEEIRGVWESWPGNRDSDIDSFLTFMSSHPETQRPHVLAVYREGKLDAILVGRLGRERIQCRVGYLQLTLTARIMYFVYGALRGNASRKNCDLLVDKILCSLSQGEADAAYMNFLRHGSDLFQLALKKPRILSRDYIRIAQPHFAAALPATAEEFYRRLSSGARWQARSKQRKLLKAFGGDVRVGCFRDVGELEDLVRDVELVAKKSYQRGLGVGFMDSPVTRDQLRLKAERGWLRAYVLYIAGRPCAFWIGDLNRSTFGSDYLAYDAKFEKYSPGMCLMLKVIEGFCDGNREGVTEIDFATGYAQYKEVLSNRKWEEESVYIFAPSFKGVGLNLVRSLFVGIDQAAKMVLARTNVLQRLKKGWRSRARSKEAAQS
jgi:hypothetical protein